MFIYALSIFLTSTAFADTNANIYFFKMSHDTRLNILTPEAQYGILSACVFFEHAVKLSVPAVNVHNVGDETALL